MSNTQNTWERMDAFFDEYGNFRDESVVTPEVKRYLTTNFWKVLVHNGEPFRLPLRYRIRRNEGANPVRVEGKYQLIMAYDCLTKQAVDIKKFSIPESNIAALRNYRELVIMCSVDHPNIAKCIYCWDEGDGSEVFYMAFPHHGEPLLNYMPEQGQNGLLKKADVGIRFSHIKRCFYQTLCALQYMHHGGLINRDLKAEDILIDSDGNVKLRDFGFARNFNSPFQSIYVGTRDFRAPELVLGLSAAMTPKVDIWSLGAIIAKLLTGKNLFDTSSTLNQLESTVMVCGAPTQEYIDEYFSSEGKLYLQGVVKKHQDAGSSLDNQDLSTIFRDIMAVMIEGGYVEDGIYHGNDFTVECLAVLDLLGRIFQFDHTKRPSADDVIKHALFNDIREEQMECQRERANVDTSNFDSGLDDRATEEEKQDELDEVMNDIKLALVEFQGRTVVQLGGQAPQLGSQEVVSATNPAQQTPVGPTTTDSEIDWDTILDDVLQGNENTPSTRQSQTDYVSPTLTGIIEDVTVGAQQFEQLRRPERPSSAISDTSTIKPPSVKMADSFYMADSPQSTGTCSSTQQPPTPEQTQLQNSINGQQNLMAHMNQPRHYQPVPNVPQGHPYLHRPMMPQHQTVTHGPAGTHPVFPAGHGQVVYNPGPNQLVEQQAARLHQMQLNQLHAQQQYAANVGYNQHQGATMNQQYRAPPPNR